MTTTLSNQQFRLAAEVVLKRSHRDARSFGYPFDARADVAFGCEHFRRHDQGMAHPFSDICGSGAARSVAKAQPPKFCPHKDIRYWRIDG